jgi:ketosteroid isomerase-like protein
MRASLRGYIRANLDMGSMTMNQVSPATPKDIVMSFNDCITRRDIEGLADLMTEDHVFIDAANGSVSGKQSCIAAWASFFAAFPDYRNIFERVSLTDGKAVMVGYSVCSDNRLSGPALWTAKVVAGLISEWRVYEDNTTNRKLLAAEDPSGL